MNNHILYQQYCDSNNGDEISEKDYINSHNISQCDYSSTFKEMDGDAEKGVVSSGYGSMNIHTVYQLNCLKSLMNLND